MNDDLDPYVEKLRLGNASEEEIFTYHFYELSEAERTQVERDMPWTVIDDLKYEIVQKLKHDPKLSKSFLINVLFDPSEIKWAKFCYWRSTVAFNNL